MNAVLPLPSDLPPVQFVGRGKLGQAVADAWRRAGGTVGDVVGRDGAWVPRHLVFEATQPATVVGHLHSCLDEGVPVVTGTTGWLDRLEEMTARAKAQGVAGFWATNFSPGVHAFNQVAAHASKVMGQLRGYEASIREVHHVHKLDAPSGTALTLKRHAVEGGLPEDTPIESIREGDVVGLHALAWESAHDSFVLQHEAKSRAGFAEGAVLALRWTWRQHQLGQHGLYTMNDLFTP